VEKLNSVHIPSFSVAWFDETSELCILRAPAITLPDYIMNISNVFLMSCLPNVGCGRPQGGGGGARPHADKRLQKG
jgi:hypothetical protein